MGIISKLFATLLIGGFILGNILYSAIPRTYESGITTYSDPLYWEAAGLWVPDGSFYWIHAIAPYREDGKIDRPKLYSKFSRFPKSALRIHGSGLREQLEGGNVLMYNLHNGKDHYHCPVFIINSEKNPRLPPLARPVFVKTQYSKFNLWVKNNIWRKPRTQWGFGRFDVNGKDMLFVYDLEYVCWPLNPYELVDEIIYLNSDAYKKNKS